MYLYIDKNILNKNLLLKKQMSYINIDLLTFKGYFQ